MFPTGCPFRKRLENWLEEEGGFLEAFIEIGSLETLLNCVKAGLASTILPKSVLTGSYEDLKVYPMPEPYQMIETGLVRRKEKYISCSYKAFADLVREKGL